MTTGRRMTPRLVLRRPREESELNSSLPDSRVFAALLEQIEGTALVQLCGQLDMAGIPNVKAAFDQAFGLGPVVVDLRSLTFIDSMGLEALLSAARRGLTRADRLSNSSGDQNRSRGCSRSTGWIPSSNGSSCPRSPRPLRVPPGGSRGSLFHV